MKAKQKTGFTIDDLIAATETVGGLVKKTPETPSV